MLTRQLLSLTLVVGLSIASTPVHLVAQAPVQPLGSISGTTADELNDDEYDDFTVQARRVQDSQIHGTSALDANGEFTFGDLMMGTYFIELVNSDGDVVCTEGPIQVTAANPVWVDVDVDCGRFPLAWWLLGAAGVAGLTAGIAAGGTTSGAQ